MSPWIGRTLVSFHQRVARQPANIQPRRDVAGRWIYSPLKEEMKAVGMDEVEKYVLHFQNTSAQYITTHPILELCIAVERRPGAQVLMPCWDRDGLDLG